MVKLNLIDLGTTLSNIAANTINNNNTLVEAALENTLSRDGTTPNQMEADFDLNGNDLLNVKNVNADFLFLDGSLVVPAELATGSFATAAQGAKADTAAQPNAQNVFTTRQTIAHNDGATNWDRRSLTLQGFQPGIDFQDTSGSAIDALINLDGNLLRTYSSTLGDGSDLVERSRLAMSTGNLTLSGFLDVASGGTGAKNASDARTNLGLTIGTSGATIPLLSTANSWSEVQTIDSGSPSPLIISRAASANNAEITYTTSGGSVFAGTSDGVDFAINSINDLTTSSAWARFTTSMTTLPAITLKTNGAITFAGTGAADTRTNLGLGTVATQDYVEETWTPVLTCATPGDLNVVYATQVGVATRIGRLRICTFEIITSTFTRTTAAGALRITGLPTAAMSAGQTLTGNLDWSGITKATFTQITPRIGPNAATINFRASGSGVTSADVNITDLPSGGTVRLIGTVTYSV